MTRRWPTLVLLTAVLAPVLASCGDDDDLPGEPTITLFEPTNNPNVSTGGS